MITDRQFIKRMAAVIATVVIVTQVFAQQMQNRIDSLEAVLPQKQGDEKLETLEDLTLLTEDLPEQKRYIDMYLEEARRQGEALRCFSEAVALARQKREQDTYFFINTYYCLASVVGYLNRFDET